MLIHLFHTVKISFSMDPKEAFMEPNVFVNFKGMLKRLCTKEPRLRNEKEKALKRINNVQEAKLFGRG